MSKTDHSKSREHGKTQDGLRRRFRKSSLNQSIKQNDEHIPFDLNQKETVSNIPISPKQISTFNQQKQRESLHPLSPSFQDTVHRDSHKLHQLQPIRSPFRFNNECSKNDRIQNDRNDKYHHLYSNRFPTADSASSSECGCDCKTGCLGAACFCTTFALTAGATWCMNGLESVIEHTLYEMDRRTDYTSRQLLADTNGPSMKYDEFMECGGIKAKCSDPKKSKNGFIEFKEQNNQNLQMMLDKDGKILTVKIATDDQENAAERQRQEQAEMDRLDEEIRNIDIEIERARAAMIGWTGNRDVQSIGYCQNVMQQMQPQWKKLEGLMNEEKTRVSPGIGDVHEGQKTKAKQLAESAKYIGDRMQADCEAALTLRMQKDWNILEECDKSLNEKTQSLRGCTTGLKQCLVGLQRMDERVFKDAAAAAAMRAAKTDVAQAKSVALQAAANAGRNRTPGSVPQPIVVAAAGSVSQSSASGSLGPPGADGEIPKGAAAPPAPGIGEASPAAGGRGEGAGRAPVLASPAPNPGIPSIRRAANISPPPPGLAPNARMMPLRSPAAAAETGGIGRAALPAARPQTTPALASQAPAAEQPQAPVPGPVKRPHSASAAPVPEPPIASVSTATSLSKLVRPADAPARVVPAALRESPVPEPVPPLVPPTGAVGRGVAATPPRAPPASTRQPPQPSLPQLAPPQLAPGRQEPPQLAPERLEPPPAPPQLAPERASPSSSSQSPQTAPGVGGTSPAARGGGGAGGAGLSATARTQPAARAGRAAPAPPLQPAAAPRTPIPSQERGTSLLGTGRLVEGPPPGVDSLLTKTMHKSSGRAVSSPVPKTNPERDLRAPPRSTVGSGAARAPSAPLLHVLPAAVHEELAGAQNEETSSAGGDAWEETMQPLAAAELKRTSLLPSAPNAVTTPATTRGAGNLAAPQMAAPQPVMSTAEVEELARQDARAAEAQPAATEIDVKTRSAAESDAVPRTATVLAAEMEATSSAGPLRTTVLAGPVRMTVPAHVEAAPAAPVLAAAQQLLPATDIVLPSPLASPVSTEKSFVGTAVGSSRGSRVGTDLGSDWDSPAISFVETPAPPPPPPAAAPEHVAAHLPGAGPLPGPPGGDKRPAPLHPPAARQEPASPMGTPEGEGPISPVPPPPASKAVTPPPPPQPQPAREGAGPAAAPPLPLPARAMPAVSLHLQSVSARTEAQPLLPPAGPNRGMAATSAAVGTPQLARSAPEPPAEQPPPQIAAALQPVASSSNFVIIQMGDDGDPCPGSPACDDDRAAH